jgi:hypothetical protein
VATLFIDNILKLHGPPAVIVSDRDRVFTSKLWHEIFQSLKISLHFSTAYHPEIDGQTERVNQCVEQYLRCMAFQEPHKWCDWLPVAECLYYSSFHSSIKMSPFEALYEYPPPQLGAAVIPSDISPEAHQTLLDRGTMLQTLQHNLAKAQPTMKKYADQNRTSRTFNVGDMVYLKMMPHREFVLGRQNARKLSSKWYGPFKILQAMGNRAYKLQLPEGTKIHNVFHVNQLKRHLGPNVVPNQTLPLVTTSGKLKTFPLAILSHRQVPRSIGEYAVAIPQWLIHWENMPEAEATWEDADFIRSTFPTFQDGAS